MTLHRTYKTHCIRGHLRTVDTVSSNGTCRICQRIRNNPHAAGGALKFERKLLRQLGFCGSGACGCGHGFSAHDRTDGYRCYAIIGASVTSYCECERFDTLKQQVVYRTPPRRLNNAPS